MNPQHSGGRRTVLAFDFGLRRIGVAAGNLELRSASAVETLKARDGVPDWNRVSELLERWQPAQLVVGLPVNMDGSEGDMAERARRFARRLEGRFGLPVSMVDERLSSRAAVEQLREAGIDPRRRRESVDRLAAKMILDSWFERSPDETAPGNG